MQLWPASCIFHSRGEWGGIKEIEWEKTGKKGKEGGRLMERRNEKDWK